MATQENESDNEKQPATEFNAEFNLRRIVPRSLMYFQNTQTIASPDHMLVRNVERGESLPVPPPHLMEYQEPVEKHLNSGRTMASIIRKALADNSIELSTCSKVLEFGCSNSRVLRHFEDLATEQSYWGCDINANTIIWNIENLSPPFNYFVSTTSPSLPICDRSFDFVFACSVFTHMDDMFFSWLLELKRIVKKDGHLFLTFLNEPSIQFGLENPNYPVGKQIAQNRDLIDGLMEGKFNIVVVHRDSDSMTYIRQDFLCKHLTTLFDIVAIVEGTMAGHQTGFLLRNR